jgi:hypothetical protein
VNGGSACALARLSGIAPTLHTRNKTTIMDADNAGIVANGLGACALSRVWPISAVCVQKQTGTAFVDALLTMGSWRLFGTGCARAPPLVSRRLCIQDRFGVGASWMLITMGS